MFGELLGTDRLRAAYETAGVNWIDAIVSAAVELEIKKSPEHGMYEARALLLVPAKSAPENRPLMQSRLYAFLHQLEYLR